MKKEKHNVWTLDELKAGLTDDAIISRINGLVEKFVSYKKVLSNNITAKQLLDIILLEEEIYKLNVGINGYYGLRFYSNTKDSESVSKLSLLKNLNAEMSNKMLFFSLWFMHLDDKIAEKLMNDPLLSKYKYFLHEIRIQKPYTKSEEIEKIITLKEVTGGEAFFSIYEMLTTGFRYDFLGKKVLQEDLTKLYHSKDPKKREGAYKAIFAKYIENGDTLTEIYKNIAINWYNESIKIREYKSPISVRNIGNDVSDSAVNALMNVVRKNFSVFAEYFKIKYELNKKQGQKYAYSRFHIYAPYEAGLKENYDYETSKKLTLETFKNFDVRFFNAAKEIFDMNHVHSHPQENKRTGAFCFATTTQIDPYILLNHSGNLRDVFTMVHEFGHGIHYMLSKSQSNLTYNAALPMAETASVFAEMILADKIMKESKNSKEKKALLVQLLDNQFATIPRQAAFILFEIYAHDNIPKGITKEKLDEYYYSILKEQFGDMEIPEIFKHEWNYLPHMHEMPFYCYAYAWGNLMVLALYEIYRKEGKGFIEKYVKLLSYGGGKNPLEMLSEIGIDASKEEFWQRGFDIIKEEIEELKRLK